MTIKSNKNQTDYFEVNGQELLKKVKQIIHEGNVRKISIETKEGKTLLVIPLTFGVISVILLPVLAAVGTLAALVTECKIKVERKK